MPLLMYKSLNNAEVAVWKATEDTAFYVSELAKHHFPLEQAEKISHLEKKRQWYASRYLLCELFPGAIQLYTNRKPYLFNGPEISFTHSGNVVAIMLSQYKSGIDVQWNDPKLETIAPRFLNPGELGIIEGAPMADRLSIIWSIKEAIFKLYVTELPFKDIKIWSYDQSTGIAEVRVKRKGEESFHNLSVAMIEDMSLAYVID